ncbi:MAG: hypothetical protein LBE10_06555 [Treponema sp.]|jgi:hypothetical protein|nr:hypothetical protein [Treponema sp.]
MGYFMEEITLSNTKDDMRVLYVKRPKLFHHEALLLPRDYSKIYDPVPKLIDCALMRTVLEQALGKTGQKPRFSPQIQVEQTLIMNLAVSLQGRLYCNNV